MSSGIDIIGRSIIHLSDIDQRRLLILPGSDLSLKLFAGKWMHRGKSCMAGGVDQRAKAGSSPERDGNMHTGRPICIY